MTLKFGFISSLFIMVVACTDTTDNVVKDKSNNQHLIDKTEMIWKGITEFDKDSTLNESPMRLYAKGFNTITIRAIKMLKNDTIDSEIIFDEIIRLRYRANTHGIKDSITEEIDAILTFKVGVGYTDQEIKRRLLKANYLFMNEMLMALVRIKKHEETLPYMMSGGKKLLKNQDMDAVIVIPEVGIVRSIIFTSPDEPMMVDYHRSHFVWALAKPRSKKDSISALIELKGDTNQRKHITLTKHYEVIQ